MYMTIVYEISYLGEMQTLRKESLYMWLCDPSTGIMLIIIDGFTGSKSGPQT